MVISMTLPTLHRHSDEVHRQRDGFVEIAEILRWFAQRRREDQIPTVGDIESIVNGDGWNTKMGFGWGVMGSGGRALRTSQGHSDGAGVTSDYLTRLHSPGWVVHGATLENAAGICQHGLNRMGRLHVHLGRMVNNRPSGLRQGSELEVVSDCNQFEAEGMRFFKSANGAILSEWFDGLIRRTYIIQVYQLRDGEILYARPGG